MSPLHLPREERYVDHSNKVGHHQDYLTLMQREDVAILRIKFVLTSCSNAFYCRQNEQVQEHKLFWKDTNLLQKVQHKPMP